nr:hypothetical protein [Tanacetum cinerariifolium]
MDQQNPTLAKILILDTGKFEQWKFKIQQYLQHEHYALWEVIEFRYSYEVPKNNAAKGSVSEGTVTKKGRIVAVTNEDMQKRRSDVKARTTLLLALPDEHQLRFSKYKTAQELWAAILKTFAKSSSGNEEGNAASIPTASTQVSHVGPNVAIASISLDTACAYIAYQSNGSQIKYEDINQIDEDDIEEMDIKWNMALLSMRADKYWKKTGKKISIQGTDVAGFDKSKVECFNCMGHFARECRALRSQDRGRRDNYRQGSKVEEQALKALMAIDGVGWDWSFMANEEENHALVADEEAPTEFALMAKTSAESEVFDNSLCSKACKQNTDSLNNKITELSKKLGDTKNMMYHYKLGLSHVEARLVEFKNQEIKFCEKIRGLELKVDFKTETIECLTNELELFKKEKEGLDSKLTGFQSASKNLDNLLESQRSDKNKKGPLPTIESTSDDIHYKNPSVTETGASDSTILSKHAIKFVKAVDRPTENKTDKVETVKKHVKKGRSCQKNNNTHKSMPPRPVIYRVDRSSLRINRPNMNAAKPKWSSFYKPAHSYDNRPFQRTSAVRFQFRSPRVSTINRKFPTVNRKFSTVNRKFPTVNRKFPTVNRKFPTGNSKISTADLGNKGKAGNSQINIDDKGYWDSGWSRYMTVNISYLSDYEPFNGGYVSFGQGGCKITGKGTIKTGQNFKLTDDTNVLLRTPRQHNMYSIDLNNVVPHKDLTFLVAKASVDECMLWHRRLGHLNIKTMNRIQKYLQNEHYALWEVIKFEDSYKAPQDDAATGLASEGSAKKKGRTVAVTIKDIQKRRNDVKARTTLLLALPDEHQLRFSKFNTAQELWAAILRTFEWLMYIIVWRNRGDLDTMSLDDVYNQLKVYEPEVQKKSKLNSQNMTFISSAKNISGNGEVNTASIPTASTQVSLASANVAAASISLDTTCAYIASQSNGSQIKYEDINQIDEDDIKEIYIKGRRENYRQGSKEEEQALKDLMTIDRVGWDWSYMANEEEKHALVAYEEAPTEFALMAKSSSDSEVEARLVKFKNQEIKFCEKIRGLESKVESKTNRIESLTNDLEMLKKEKEGLDSKLTVRFPPPAQVYSPPKTDMSWTGLPEFVDDTITDYSRPSPSIESNSIDLQNNSSSVSKNGESTSSILSKPEVKFVKATDSLTVIKTNKDETVRKPYVKYTEMYRKTSKSSNVRGNQRNWNNLKSQQLGKNFLMKNKACFNCGDFDHLSYDCGQQLELNFEFQRFPLFQRIFPLLPKNFPLVTQSFLLLIWEIREKMLRPQLVGFGDLNKTLLSKDSGCSWHMTGNISYLSDYKPYDGGTPKQHNMYSIDLNNVVPHKDLTCLVAKASADESELWHRRLGHLNFKTMNKLVRHNLVRGLPSNCFENDHTYAACLKGKQHTASCKTKLVHSVTKPLHTLHMDLFGPTSVSSLNHTWYCLVVTDDFSRCDNGGEFRNKEMNDFCSRKGIKREFSNARTPQQNRVAKRRNMTLIEAARTMLANAKLPVTFEDILGVTTNTGDTNRVEADLSNMENNISASLTPTFKIHKDHPTSQIIGPMDTLVQTKNKSKEMEEQSFIASIHHKTNPDLLQFCLFSCFLSQEEPKKISDALKDPIYQMDVKSAFLYGTIDEEVYVMQPPGFQDPEFPARVYNVEKAMYGLYQAPRAWYEEGWIFLSQDKYVGDILKKFGYSDVRSANTLMDKENPWGKDETSKDVDLHLYRSMIGSLMYLITSRPDIMFAVCACARHQVTPKECHLHAVKSIFRYLKSHPNLGIWYPKDSPFDLVAYSDSHYGGATQDRKSTTKGCQFLEYVAVASGCGQVLWIQNQLLDDGSYTAKTFDLVWIWLGGNYRNLFLNGLYWDSVVHMCINFPHGSDSEQRTHEFMHVYLVFASVYVWIGVETLDEGTKILATVDGKPKTIFESLIRRNLKLNDEAGIISLSDAEPFENLTLMGVKVQELPLSPHHTPSPEDPQSLQHDLSSSIHPPVTTKTIPTVTPTDIPTLSQGEACLTVSGLEAGQDKANIIKSSTLPYDSTPRITSFAADEGSMQQQLNELMDLCTHLQRYQTEMAFKIAAQDLEITILKARIKLLEDKDRGGDEPSGEDATIKGRSLETGEEACIEKSTERGKVPTVSVPTGSGMVPTASPIFTTAGVVTPYVRRKGKEKMVESDTPKKKRLHEQIDVQMAREM